MAQERGNHGDEAETVHGGVQGSGSPRRLQRRQDHQRTAYQFGVHPTLIQDWKKHLLTTAQQVFANGVKTDTTAQTEAQKAELFEQIGRLKMELEWLKKSRTYLLSNGGG